VSAPLKASLVRCVALGEPAAKALARESLSRAQKAKRNGLCAIAEGGDGGSVGGVGGGGTGSIFAGSVQTGSIVAGSARVGSARSGAATSLQAGPTTAGKASGVGGGEEMGSEKLAELLRQLQVDVFAEQAGCVCMCWSVCAVMC
jgi:hypothetical protein